MLDIRIDILNQTNKLPEYLNIVLKYCPLKKPSIKAYNNIVII